MQQPIHDLQVRNTTDQDMAAIYLQTPQDDVSTKQSLAAALQRIGATPGDQPTTAAALSRLSEDCLTVTMGDRIMAIFDPAEEQNPAPDEDFNADLVWLRPGTDPTKVKNALDSWFQMQSGLFASLFGDEFADAYGE